ncbi:hypothetical protein XELAEV_18046371mg [Xenopus laevis]|uniref:Uncharacterized protein n=1 Tax=Xenopus laevis TaxID=8355 RepID=A0A974BT67_XENLA|nr:hypothetical protein XELAEV_18046371mg [Xenopus laevis]
MRERPVQLNRGGRLYRTNRTQDHEAKKLGVLTLRAEPSLYFDPSTALYGQGGRADPENTTNSLSQS